MKPYQSVYEASFSTIDDDLRFFDDEIPPDMINLRVAEAIRGFAPLQYAPNYCGDLNWAYLMEESLGLTGPWIDYVKILGRIFMRDLNGKGIGEIHNSRCQESLAHSIINFTHATAKQRCLAFLIYHSCLARTMPPKPE